MVYGVWCMACGVRTGGRAVQYACSRDGLLQCQHHKRCLGRREAVFVEILGLVTLIQNDDLGGIQVQKVATASQSKSSIVRI
jgi:hypothetical protein